MNRPLATTARTHTRLSQADQAKLLARLQPYLPNPQTWNHPDIELEIGIGNGLAMFERAKAQPERLFVGSEVYLNGLKTLLHHLSKVENAGQPGEIDHRPSNIRITNQDARTLLQSIPAGSLSRILIPFPDPWPKARHHKRRIVQPDLLDACAKALKPGGELWVITDWPSYAYHVIATIFPHPSFTLAQTDRAAADCKPSARLAAGEPNTESRIPNTALGPHNLGQAPTWWQPTKYQQKADTAGRAPWFICATKA